MCMPKPIVKFTESGILIGDIISERMGYDASDYPWAKRMLGKFPIPEWQRDSVWTIEQKISFIESVYLGYDLGSVVINGYKEINRALVKHSDILIDGQQRTEAILEYVAGEFKVFGAYWADVAVNDKSRFRMRQLGRRTTHCFDEVILKQIYNHLNFSGTSHNEVERA